MNIDFNKEDTAFKKQVEDFINQNLDKELQNKIYNGEKPSKNEVIDWQIKLNEKGWLAPDWPLEYGGCDWTPTKKYIFEQEMANANTPQIVPFGVTMIGPVLIKYGTPEQKSYFLPKILNSDHWWCQGYSEPGSGSDLASLKCKAENKGDNYIINGTKTWTTLAQYADWMFCLVRTSNQGKPQEGISFIMIDMNTVGIKVDPIITLDGSHEINTVYLEDVVVPKKNLIFEENKGWTVAKYLLGHERTSIAAVGRSKSALKKLKNIAIEELNNDMPLIEDTRFRDKLTNLEMDLAALEYTELRILSEMSKGASPGAEASLLKIRGSEMQQKISELTLDAVAYYGLSNLENSKKGSNNMPIGPSYSNGVGNNYLNLRKTTIYGGSNEIQKNILTKMVLGL
ncbi:MAG: pimeloyl-CoA dehydrogenase large subunit [Rickettsiales bacterium]|nr:pimeloyl-CoA dehydrogenase large subunit [Rickettsiales bacterium]